MMKICSAAVVILLSVYPAMAQYSNPRVTIFAAGSFPTGDRQFVLVSTAPVQGNVPIGPFESELAKGAKIGGRFNLDLTDVWAGEASYSFGSNDLRITEMFGFVPPGQSAREREFDVHFHEFLVNGSYYFFPPDREWRPFATAGIGLKRYSPTDGAKEAASTNFLLGPTRISSDTEFAFNFGGGVEARITENIGLRFDLRDHLTGTPRFGLPTEPLNPGGVYYPVKGVLHTWEIAIGGVYYFQ
jgi:opacity protein-like surface antigen